MLQHKGQVLNDVLSTNSTSKRVNNSHLLSSVIKHKLPKLQHLIDRDVL